VVPRAGLDAVVKRKKSHFLPGIKPRSSSPWLIHLQTELLLDASRYFWDSIEEMSSLCYSSVATHVMFPSRKQERPRKAALSPTPYLLGNLLIRIRRKWKGNGMRLAETVA